MRLLPDDLAGALHGLRQAGGGFVARCPAHDDHKPSLSLTVEDSGRVLVHCHAGCDQQSVIDALGIDPAALRGNQDNDHDAWTPHGSAVSIYDYRDEKGVLLYQVCRTLGKQFPQRRPDSTSKSGWTWRLGDTRRVPYRLPELLAGVAGGKPVWVVEGEKDVESLVRAGQVATCNPGGAGKWRTEFAEHLRGARVTVCADADEPGQRHARAVAASLTGVAALVRVVEPAAGHKDITDHLRAGLAISDVRVTVTPEEPERPRLAPDIHELLAGDDPEYDWLVKGLLERGDRLMLTGIEGSGKSVMVRQLAICLAAGIHPFHAGHIDPLRVLFVDCENSLLQTRRGTRAMVGLAERLGRRVPDGALRVELITDGIDLNSHDDAAWLIERVVAHQPDVCFVGPLYKLQRADMKDEQAARITVAALDAVRLRANCAMVIESHSGHGEWNKARSVRPIGSSLFLRWPEFGYGLKPYEGTDEMTRSPLRFSAWRGPRDERAWPDYVRRGGPGEWPWVPAPQLADVPASAWTEQRRDLA